MSFTNFTGARPPFGNIVQPGAYSILDASALSSNPLLARVPTPAAIGTSLGGVPDTPMYFRAPGAAHQVLIDGPGHDMVQHIFAGGASVVGFVRCGNSPTQGSLNLAGVGGATLTLTSRDFGSWTNSLLVTVISSGPVIMIQYTDSVGSVFTEIFDFTTLSGATLAQIVQAINGQPNALYGYQPSNYVTASVATGTLPLSAVASTPLTGGTDGLNPVAGDWATALAVLEPELVDIICMATGDQSIHAQALAHCNQCSTAAARRERVMTYGGVLGEDVDASITRANNLRDKRAQQVYPGVEDFDPQGNLTFYDPFYAAGRLAGMHCALQDAATPLTHAPFPCVGLETNLSSVQGGPIDQLLNAGVTPLAPAPAGGFWVVDSLSTYNIDATFRDFHKIRSADAVQSRVRFVLESAYVGGKNSPGTTDSMAASADAELDDLVTEEIIVAHDSTIVTQGDNANTFLVSLPIVLVDTDKYIFLTFSLQPSSTLTTTTTESA